MGIFHPKKFGFITSDNIKAIIMPMPIEKKLTILVKINTFNNSRRNTDVLLQRRQSDLVLKFL